MRQHIHWKTTSDYPYVLNLDDSFNSIMFDDTFNPITLGVNLSHKKFDFKGGEPHFQITTDIQYIGDLIITQRYNKIGDLFDIILANDAARRMGFKNISLILPYFPAARQDRVCNGGEPLTIKVFTDMINGCGFDSVTILCPHSEVTPALINNVVVLDELKYVSEIIIDDECETFNIVCPDAGAGKRVGKVIQHLSNAYSITKKFNLIRCEKVRDVKDGSIKEFFVDSQDLGGHPCLIVDDILSLGGTFKGLGNILRERNCGRLMLYTTHADCVEGIQSMVEFFDHVYTTNSKQDWDKYKYTFDNRFTCFKIKL
jgi:ribose-phosphate pyrophosphokinase